MNAVQRQIFITVGAILFGFVSLAIPAHGDSSPTTQPDSPQFRQWIAQLADADPDVRDSAAQQLMNLKRDDLPTLRQAALGQRPLLPMQISALHEIVSQVFLASEPYKPMRGIAFLGVSRSMSRMDTEDDPDGVVVADRVLGFDAYRQLRNGDVIVKLLDNPEIPMHTFAQLHDTVRALGPGRTLRFEVLRDGRPVVVSVLLQARPLELPDSGDPAEWIKARAEKAEKYWESNFSLLDRDAATTDATAGSAP
jgi:hypothetical protein